MRDRFPTLLALTLFLLPLLPASAAARLVGAPMPAWGRDSVELGVRLSAGGGETSNYYRYAPDDVSGVPRDIELDTSELQLRMGYFPSRTLELYAGYERQWRVYDEGRASEQDQQWDHLVLGLAPNFPISRTAAIELDLSWAYRFDGPDLFYGQDHHYLGVAVGFRVHLAPSLALRAGVGLRTGVDFDRFEEDNETTGHAMVGLSFFHRPPPRLR